MAQVYEVAIYSISTGLDKFRKTSRNLNKIMSKYNKFIL